MLQLSKGCLLSGTLLAVFAFPAGAQTYAGHNQQVIVSVYNDSGVSPRTLAQAEQKTIRIFEHAGLEVVWKNCSSSGEHVGPIALVPATEHSSPVLEPERDAGYHAAGRALTPAPASPGPDCAQFEWPTHLAVRIVPESKNWTSEVFGAAFLSAKGTGCYTDVFYQSAVELHSAWNVDLSDILGSVMAHELGHLLLGSNSHAPTGIMRARWQGEELSRAARGSLLFTAEQSEHMRAKLVATRAPLAVTARASY